MSDVFHRATDWEIVSPTRVLRVTWDDGKVSEYPWEPLRRACMCAYCHGEGAYQGEVNDDTRFRCSIKSGPSGAKTSTRAATPGYISF